MQSERTTLTVLITRPLEASEELASQLSQSGMHGVVMPFYAFAAQQPDVDVAAFLAGSDGRRMVVFTSPRAVDYGIGYIPLAQRAGLEFASVGDATRRQLEALGLTVNWQPESGYTSEDLLALAGLKSNPGTAIVMCAPDGRGVLKPGLESLGWTVSNAMVYQRVWTPPAAQKIDEIVAAQQLLSVWTSTSALIGAQKNLPAEAWSKILAAPALVVSRRIKHHLQQRGASDISITGGPGNADLLQSIKDFVEHRQC